MILVVQRLVFYHARVGCRLVAYFRMRNMREKRRTLVDIQVAARVCEFDCVVHIGYRSTTTDWLALLERSGVDDALEVFDRETLVSVNIGRIGSNGFEADIIQCKVITDILQTLIQIDDPQCHIGTGNRRFDNG